MANCHVAHIFGAEVELQYGSDRGERQDQFDA